jgi:hypothetical protein
VRIAWALARLGVHAFAILMFLGATAGFIVSLRRDFHGVGTTWSGLPAQLLGRGRIAAMSNWMDGGGLGDLMAWGLAAVVAGGWMRAMMPHWRWWTLLLAWAALLTGVLTLEPIGAGLDAWFDRLAGATALYRGPRLWEWADGLVGAALTVVLGGAGALVGALMLRLAPRYRSWRFARMRAGIRKLRQA